jgi:hypothetical protein
MDWLSFIFGALVLRLGQFVYSRQRRSGEVTELEDAKNAEYLHLVIRHAPRDPRADISEAQRRDVN